MDRQLSRCGRVGDGSVGGGLGFFRVVWEEEVICFSLPGFVSDVFLPRGIINVDIKRVFGSLLVALLFVYWGLKTFASADAMLCAMHVCPIGGSWLMKLGLFCFWMLAFSTFELWGYLFFFFNGYGVLPWWVQKCVILHTCRELIDQQRQCTYTHVNTGSSRIYMHLYVPDFVSPVGLVS